MWITNSCGSFDFSHISSTKKILLFIHADKKDEYKIIHKYKQIPN